jgi:transcriptional regulator with XRE-family HTH domain
MFIGNKIRGLRAENGFTTHQVAEKLGISEPTYRKLEGNKSSPDLIMIRKVAVAFNIAIFEILPSDFFENKQIDIYYQKLIDQYEIRLKEKDELINDLKR